MGAGQPTIVVIDASVLINFLKIDRMDLIAYQSHDFVVTDHVAAEISSRYPDQQQRFTLATSTGAISQVSITNPREISVFRSLSRSRRLGTGECSAIAMAVCRQHILAIDDRRATTHARQTSQTLQIINTQDLMVSMIGEDLLDIPEADSIKDVWAIQHQFRLKIRSFQDLVR